MLCRIDSKHAQSLAAHSWATLHRLLGPCPALSIFFSSTCQVCSLSMHTQSWITQKTNQQRKLYQLTKLQNLYCVCDNGIVSCMPDDPRLDIPSVQEADIQLISIWTSLCSCLYLAIMGVVSSYACDARDVQCLSSGTVKEHRALLIYLV